MQLLHGSRRQRIDSLITILGVLGILLIVLAVVALWRDALDLMARFRQPIFMFVIGALLAYLLTPIVHLLQKVVRKRWAAVLASYLVLFLALSVFAVLLINPFIKQARSLVNNLHNPAPSSLSGLKDVSTLSAKIRVELNRQLASNTQSIPSAQVRKTRTAIDTLRRESAQLSTGKATPNQITLPKSYVEPIRIGADRSSAEYANALGTPGQVNRQALIRANVDAGRAAATAATSYTNAAGTPRLLLDLQRLVDDRGVQVDLHDKFGMALKQFTAQLASLLNNALGIALQAGSLLLTTVLVLIISVYFISDGSRFVRWLIGLAPADSRDNVAYLVKRLDQLLGSYLRVQVLMALLAAILDAAGAVVIGVPYPIVIFFSTFFLSLIPVIGPVVLPVPPMLLAVVFTPLPKPLFFLMWLLIGEQIATNIIGPRIQGKSVGIHPLEAMAAALIGFPIAGFLGSFFAVPMVAFAHVVAREIVRVRHGLPAEDEPEQQGTIHAAAASPVSASPRRS